MSDQTLRKPVRILIVDDHPIVISGCRAMLAGELNCTIVSACNVETGVAVARRERPDVCIIDLNLPGESGFELCRRILAEDPDKRIIIFSMNDDPVFAAKAIELGVLGYASKAGDPTDLVKAIREVIAGGVYLPAAIARSLAFARRSSPPNFMALLNPRELEIFRHLGQGRTLGEIAPSIGASYKTVANSCTAIKRKLGVRTSSDLVRLAVENRLAAT